MMTKSRSANNHEGSVRYKKVTTEASDFHAKRVSRELKIEAMQESSSKPAGTDEYEQLVAEEASFNTRPMIEQAAFLLAEQRGFAPGKELTDWLRAEAEIEGVLRKSVVIERRVAATEDRRHRQSVKN